MQRLILILLTLAAWNCRAEYVRNNFESIRALGMGGAFLAIADDSNAIWYNPAALAHVKGFHWSILDVSLGTESTDTVRELARAVWDRNTEGLVKPGKTYARVGVRSVFTAPYFSVAVFNHLNAFYDLQDLSDFNNTFDIYSTNDIGGAIGAGIPLGPYFSVGGSLKVFQRFGADMLIRGTDLIDDLGITEDEFRDNLYRSLENSVGSGLGVSGTLSALAQLPLPKGYPQIRFAATAEDVGGTAFRTFGGRSPLASVPMSVHLGSSVKYSLAKGTELNLALDYRHAFKGMPFFKHTHLGFEYRIPMLSFRAGFYQGQPTAGVSLEAPPHTRIVFETHAFELGTSFWQRGQRIYSLQFVLGFNPLF